mmetsp:Transcript_42335/g.111446  ORF Transcript_42335/g.111446 Transcript_42335/m.111446 type:complete len:270 (-) Transcript_42335:784-1593(-)
MSQPRCGSPPSVVELLGQPHHVAALDADGADGLLGELVVFAPLQSDGRVELEVWDAAHEGVDTLLGQVGEAHGVDADLEVVVTAVERARLDDQRGLAVVTGGPVEPERFHVVDARQQLAALLDAQVGRAREPTLGCVLHEALEEPRCRAVCAHPAFQVGRARCEHGHYLVARAVDGTTHERRGFGGQDDVDHEAARQPGGVGRRLAVGRRRQRQPLGHVELDVLSPLEDIQSRRRVHVRCRGGLQPALLVVWADAQLELGAVTVAHLEV